MGEVVETGMMKNIRKRDQVVIPFCHLPVVMFFCQAVPIFFSTNDGLAAMNKTDPAALLEKPPAIYMAAFAGQAGHVRVPEN